MRIIHNRFIPSRKFYAVNLFGWLFVRHGVELHAEDINHELIHTAQMREMLFVGFYIWYGLEWVMLLLKYRHPMSAYRNLSFEQEAYDHGDDLGYLRRRRHYAWLWYYRRERRTPEA